ncbi:MAG TPA: SDR family oxidoreductase [Gaiellales bacterium]|jgi:3-oxoacyl-[acyl-carrier protein] reductase|nr:SDR family oxidoreductase [Gaiellales bacterium]
MADQGRPVAVVTGAANGIGAAIAARLRQDGMLVVGLDIEPCETGPSVEADVSAIESHDSLIERVAAEHGPVKAMVNVAGVFIPESVADLTPASYRRQLGVMLDGPIWLARAAGLHMAHNGGGRIVNITSIHATNSERTALSYDAAKGGLEAATRTLALELGEHGVLVNSLAPGFVRTRMSVVNGVDELDGDWFKDNYVESGRLPVRRAAEPSEIAAVVSFLVSEDNTYTNGARIVVDGGLTVTF